MRKPSASTRSPDDRSESIVVRDAQIVSKHFENVFAVLKLIRLMIAPSVLSVGYNIL